MAALHLILGVVGVVLGAFMILKRDWITANHQRRKGRAEVPMFWMIFGGLMVLLGVGQIVLGV